MPSLLHLLALFVGMAHCTRLTLLGKGLGKQDGFQIDNLFGKPFLSLSHTAPKPQANPDLDELAAQVIDLMKYSGDSTMLLARLRSLELSSYDYFCKRQDLVVGFLRTCFRVFGTFSSAKVAIGLGLMMFSIWSSSRKRSMESNTLVSSLFIMI